MSDESELPGELRLLLGGPVDSLEKMEVLCLCWRETAQAWTVTAAGERLRLPHELVATACEQLAQAGLLAAAVDGYRLAAGDQPALISLCRVYDADRLLVLREMTALAMDRIRNSAARAFADAFRIRRRDPGKGGSDA